MYTQDNLPSFLKSPAHTRENSLQMANGILELEGWGMHLLEAYLHIHFKNSHWENGNKVFGNQVPMLLEVPNHYYSSYKNLHRLICFLFSRNKGCQWGRRMLYCFLISNKSSLSPRPFSVQPLARPRWPKAPSSEPWKSWAKYFPWSIHNHLCKLV